MILGSCYVCSICLMLHDSDYSIFVPGGSPAETGFRRSELLPEIDLSQNGNSSTVQGTTTFHWSVRTDPTRPLNYSHEYHVHRPLPIWLHWR